MAPIWLAIPLPSYLSLSLLSGLLACGVLVLFFSYQRSKRVAAKTDSEVCNATFPCNPLPPAPETINISALWGMGRMELGEGVCVLYQYITH